MPQIRQKSQRPLWTFSGQLPSSFRQPHFSPSVSALPVHALTTSSHSVNLPLSPSITLSLSFPAEDLPLLQTFPTIDSLPASGLTPRTLRPDRFFWASPFYVCFSFFIILVCLVPCGRLSCLLVSFWAHVNVVHRIVLYRIKGQYAMERRGHKRSTSEMEADIPGTSKPFTTYATDRLSKVLCFFCQLDSR